MQRILCTLVLSLTACALAQQGQQLPSQPPYETPPTFPRDQQQLPKQMPPDQDAPPEDLSDPEATRQIQQGLKSEPALRDSDIAVKVDQASVTLTGTVHTDDQHELALRIARSYAGDRKIIDKLKLTQQT
jgi:hypothetical protein